MTDAIEEWKIALGQLPGAERAELAHFLLATLEPEEEDAASAWDQEIAHRLDEIRQGTVKGRPAEVVFEELRNRFP